MQTTELAEFSWELGKSSVEAEEIGRDWLHLHFGKGKTVVFLLRTRVRSKDIREGGKIGVGSDAGLAATIFIHGEDCV